MLLFPLASCDEFLNTPAYADAGADQTITLGETAALDGSESSDVDGDSLTFS